MRYEILLILSFIVAPLLGSAQGPLISTTGDIRSYFETTVDQIKSQKDKQEKYKTLTSLKIFLYKEIAERYKIMDSLYRRSLELEDLLVKSKSLNLESELQLIKDSLSVESSIYEELNNYEYSFKNIFIVFLDRKKDESISCDSLKGSIMINFLGTAPENSVVPTHAKLAIDLAQNLCK